MIFRVNEEFELENKIVEDTDLGTKNQKLYEQIIDTTGNHKLELWK